MTYTVVEVTLRLFLWLRAFTIVKKSKQKLTMVNCVVDFYISQMASCLNVVNQTAIWWLKQICSDIPLSLACMSPAVSHGFRTRGPYNYCSSSINCCYPESSEIQIYCPEHVFSSEQTTARLPHCSPHKANAEKTSFCAAKKSGHLSRGGTSYNGLYGEAPPERGTFFRLQVYKRVGISQI